LTVLKPVSFSRRTLPHGVSKQVKRYVSNYVNANAPFAIAASLTRGIDM
jgi:hypothetical protein